MDMDMVAGEVGLLVEEGGHSGFFSYWDFIICLAANNIYHENEGVAKNYAKNDTWPGHIETHCEQTDRLLKTDLYVDLKL